MSGSCMSSFARGAAAEAAHIGRNGGLSLAILLLTAMAAGAVVLPEPIGDRRTWLSYGDFPSDELRAEHNGSIHYKAVVKPDGKVESCVIEVSTASAHDKATFCGKIKSRFRFRKVLGPAGAPRYYVLKEPFLYVLPDSKAARPVWPGPDFAIDVQALPKALNGRVEVSVNVAVDAVGHLTACDVPASAAQAALAKVACGQLPTIWSAMPEKNAAGEPIAYVRQMRVEFREAGAPAS